MRHYRFGLRLMHGCSAPCTISILFISPVLSSALSSNYKMKFNLFIAFKICLAFVFCLCAFYEWTDNHHEFAINCYFDALYCHNFDNGTFIRLSWFASKLCAQITHNKTIKLIPQTNCFSSFCCDRANEMQRRRHTDPGTYAYANSNTEM